MRKYPLASQLEVGDVVLKGNKTVHFTILPVDVKIDSLSSAADQSQVVTYHFHAVDTEHPVKGWASGFLHLRPDATIEIERAE